MFIKIWTFRIIVTVCIFYEVCVSGPCDADNGDCEHICIPLGRNIIFQCSYGFVVDNHKQTCSSDTKPLSDNFIYVADDKNNKVYQLSLINDDVNALDSSTVDSPLGVLYNSITKRIIWTDNKANYIHSANVNGTGYSVLVDVRVYSALPNQLALDYSTGNIYYTAIGSSNSTIVFTGIGVVSPDGLHRKLISEGVKPWGIAIESVRGFLFWTDWATTPAVLKRAHTDGTNIVTLSTKLVWPLGIAIDTSASALYVNDCNTNIIYRCGYEANTCVQYSSDPGAHLIDIKLLGNYLYYTAWNKVYITKLHKRITNDTAKIANNAKLGRLNSISLYSSTFLQTNVQSQCSSNNGRGNCSTFCHPKPNGFSCGCPDVEQLLPDGNTCPSALTTTTSSISTTPTSLSTSTTPWVNKSSNEIISSSQSVYIGAGAGGTVAIVIIVVAIVFVYRKCGKKAKTGARILHTNPDDQALYANEAVILQQGDICKKTFSVAENLKKEHKYCAQQVENEIYDEIDPIGH